MPEELPVAVQNNNLFGYIKKPKSHKAVFITALFFLLIIFFLAGWAVGASRSFSNAGVPGQVNPGQVLNTDSLPDYLTKDVNFKLFWKVWDIIREKYIDKDKITNAQLFYGALSGSVAALNDPYSVFLTPADSEEFNEELSGRFEGIGAEIGMKNDRLTVISPLPDSPAAKAGVRALDKIIAIDGKETTGISLDVAVKSIRGERGSTVVLTIAREGENEFKDISIVRDQIKVESVLWEMKNNNIAYIRLTNFNNDTADSFRQKVNEVLTKSPKGIILDLRNNPGGFLDTAIELAGYWVANGQVVVKEEFNDPELNQDYSSHGQGLLKDYPIVVLVNQASASASEILAGALQDYGLAKTVGMQTFGKGSVQELEKLNDGSSIKITVARWLTPQGRYIDQNGIAPDIEVDLTKEDYDNNRDPQLDKALEILNQ